MKYVIGIITGSFLYFLLIAFFYFLLLLINELIVMAFGANPLRWLKENIFEPVGHGLLIMLHMDQ